MKRVFGIFVAMLAFAPLAAHAQSAPDLGLSGSDIVFSTQTLVAGSSVRIYASIHNYGNVDSTAYVFFYQGDVPIGASQIVTVSTTGHDDEVWVDFTVPYSSFNIRAEIRGQDPADINPANDLAITTLFTPLVDEDRDGVADENDNCPDVPNSSQQDADADGAGDACDTDDDNDGVSDAVENEIGTDQFNQDTDGDGVPDGKDAKPLDPTVQVAEQIAPAVTTSTPIAPDESSQPTTAEPSTSEPAQTAEDVQTDVQQEPAVDFTSDVQNVSYSPKAAFVYSPTSWKTYHFESLHPVAANIQLTWDFGDGVTSSASRVDHTYLKPGKYVVTLTALDDSGHSEADSATVRISFFHLANPFVKLLLGLLGLAFFSSLILAFWHGKKKRSVAPVVDQVEKPRPKTIKRKKS